MDNFIQQLGQRAHLTPEQSKSTVEFMTEYFKKNLPAPVVEQILTALKGSTVAAPAEVVAAIKR
jgi:hypothetical protein